MFNDDDFPFRAMNAMGQMHSQMMQDMDMMMNGMMRRGSPFLGFPSFGFGAHPFGGITDGSGMRPSRRRHELEMDPFAGFGGLIGAMTNGHLPTTGGNMFVSTQMMTIGPDGKPHVEQQTVHKSGDVTETKKRIDRDGESTMTIGHSIGDRSHYIEKKRDKDGNVRKQQKFVNLDEASAEQFDREFTQRVRYGGRNESRISSAIEYSEPATRRSASKNAPIVTLPEEEESSSSFPSSNRIGGPVIREISEEEAEQSIPKRRRGLFGGFRAE